jgi:hypothetical protein
MYKASQNNTTPSSVDFLVMVMQRDFLTACDVPNKHLNRIYVKLSGSLIEKERSSTLSPRASNDRMAVGAV